MISASLLMKLSLYPKVPPLVMKQFMIILETCELMAIKFGICLLNGAEIHRLENAVQAWASKTLLFMKINGTFVSFWQLQWKPLLGGVIGRLVQLVKDPGVSVDWSVATSTPHAWIVEKKTTCFGSFKEEDNEMGGGAGPDDTQRSHLMWFGVHQLKASVLQWLPAFDVNADISLQNIM